MNKYLKRFGIPAYLTISLSLFVKDTLDAIDFKKQKFEEGKLMYRDYEYYSKKEPESKKADIGYYKQFHCFNVYSEECNKNKNNIKHVILNDNRNMVSRAMASLAAPVFLPFLYVGVTIAKAISD